jgi:hypothetical protein
MANEEAAESSGYEKLRLCFQKPNEPWVAELQILN